MRSGGGPAGTGGTEYVPENSGAGRIAVSCMNGSDICWVLPFAPAALGVSCGRGGRIGPAGYFSPPGYQLKALIRVTLVTMVSLSASTATALWPHRTTTSAHGQQ